MPTILEIENALAWFSRANWDYRVKEVNTIRQVLNSYIAMYEERSKWPNTDNMRWLLANTNPEIGWPQQAMDALVDITQVCERLEKSLTPQNSANDVVPEKPDERELDYKALYQSIFDWAQDCKGSPLDDDINCLLQIIDNHRQALTTRTPVKVDVGALKRDLRKTLMIEMPSDDNLKYWGFLTMVINHLISAGVIMEDV